MKTTRKLLIVIAGPTASGKTAAAIAVAQHFNTVVVSADSRQVYREMTIGTAKPGKAELSAVNHYFINSHSVIEGFSAGDYERECLELLDTLFKRHNMVVMAGGSGLFIKSVLDGLDNIPAASEAIRSRLNNELDLYGKAYLQEKLKAADPVYFSEVDINNPKRLIRALEVIESTGQMFSAFRRGGNVYRPFDVIRFGLNTEREKLYERIDNRVDLMIADGLLDEVRSLIDYRNLNALKTVGYSELFGFLDGRSDFSSAIEAIKQNTRRYAKRQLTWFTKDNKIIWEDTSNIEFVNDIIKRCVSFIT